MRTLRPLTVGLIALATVAVTAPSAAAPAAANQGLHRAIVAFHGERLPVDLAARLDTLGVTEAVAFETIDAVAVTAPVTSLARLAHDPAVRAVRSERRIELDLYSSVPQIGADRAHQPETFRFRGRDITRPGVTGEGQVVAVLDTGIFAQHPDLQGQVIDHLNFEFAYGVNLLTAGALDAYAEATGTANTTDDIGHGTHVGGIVAGTGAASQGRENHGVAPGARLVDLRIAAGPVQGLVEDTGWERNAIAAFDWLIRHEDDTRFGPHGINVNTNSWGLTGHDLLFGSPEYDPLADIIREVNDRGIVTVFSAGNDGAEDDVTGATVPNGLPEVISVAAACKPDSYTSACDPEQDADAADFTSHGDAVDVAAPGVGILSAVQPASIVGALAKSGVYGDHWGGDPDQQIVHRAAYGSASGTSMAGPHVAGVVALVLQANPDLTPEQVRWILAATADDMANAVQEGVVAGRDRVTGWGLVDVPEALRVAALVDHFPERSIRRAIKRFHAEPYRP